MALGGQEARIKISGSPTDFIDEATTTTDNRIYTISDNTKQIWDYNSPVTVKIAGVITTEDYLLDMTKGIVIFSQVDTNRGAVTVSGKYVNTTVAGYAHKYTLKQEVEIYDVTKFGDIYKKKLAGAKSASGTISDFNVLDSYYSDALLSGNAVLLEFSAFDGDTNSKRIWALIESQEMASALGSPQDKTVSFQSTGIY